MHNVIVPCKRLEYCYLLNIEGAPSFHIITTTLSFGKRMGKPTFLALIQFGMVLTLSFLRMIRKCGSAEIGMSLYQCYPNLTRKDM